ncbi:MAG: response regulator [Caulobacteraceae bacterium]|nr:response regulator [Caulobacteraceae bacterium]
MPKRTTDAVPGASGGPPPRSSNPNPGVEEARRGAETRLRLALEAAGIGVWDYDITNDRMVWDERLCELTESGPETQVTWSRHFLPALHPDDRGPVSAAFANVAEEGDGGRLSVECRVVGRATRRVTWVTLQGLCQAGADGSLHVAGAVRDITDERRLAEDLRQMNESLERRVGEAVAERQLWADMFEGSDDPVAAVDNDLRFIAMNDAYVATCERLFGVRFQVGDRVDEALAHLPEARDAAADLWRRALGGEVIEIPRSGETDPSGSYFDIKMSPLRRHGAIIGAYQYSRDVTPRVRAQLRLRETQAALQRAQKMEALGQLTGGVAHDFNNLLQVISGNLQLLSKEVAGSERAELRIRNALAGVARGTKLAAQLLAFGRRQPLEPRVCNLGRFLQGMDDMLRRTLGEEVELETIVSGGLWNTLIDPSQLENAILNLAINARDAMEGVGRLTLEAGNAFLDDEYCRLHEEVAPGQYVMVAVTDTGCGMTREVMERVFEPFFSTKPEGHGTGLGLSMVYGLIKQSKGHVKIYSEPGEGTTIKLYVPRAVQLEEALQEAHSGPAGGGDETILVVEDDEQVCETAVAMLSELGYRVLKARDAASALNVVESGVAIDLIFTDVVMPGPMRSHELAARAHEKIPGVSVLFTSGYTENSIVHGGRLDPGVELLSKPYTREALARKVRHVLSGGGQAALEAERGRQRQVDGGVQSEARDRGLRVLLVEDDELVRANTSEMLADLGHSVTGCADGETALRVLVEADVDVMVVDRVLPGLSGDALVQKALELRPELEVVFATGEAAAVPDIAQPGAVFLVKPYAAADLARALAQAILVKARREASESPPVTPSVDSGSARSAPVRSDRRPA